MADVRTGGLDDATRAALQASLAPGQVLVTETGQGPYTQAMLDGAHMVIADEPEAVGGRDLGPTPYSYLLMALGACTAMTVRMYAARKGWPLDRVTVRLAQSRIHAADCADCEKPGATLDRIARTLSFAGALDDAQRQRLMQIADACPVHKALSRGIPVRTELAAD